MNFMINHGNIRWGRDLWIYASCQDIVFLHHRGTQCQSVRGGGYEYLSTSNVGNALFTFVFHKAVDSARQGSFGLFQILFVYLISF